jgi:hypothetical protein
MNGPRAAHRAAPPWPRPRAGPSCRLSLIGGDAKDDLAKDDTNKGGDIDCYICAARHGVVVNNMNHRHDGVHSEYLEGQLSALDLTVVRVESHAVTICENSSCSNHYDSPARRSIERTFGGLSLVSELAVNVKRTGWNFQTSKLS